MLAQKANMAGMKPIGKPGLEDDALPIHRIRITLTSRNVKNLEKGAPSPVVQRALCEFKPLWFSVSGLLYTCYCSVGLV